MTQRIRLWKVVDRQAQGGGRPQEIPSSEVGLEKQLEAWLEHDISMLDPGLLVVGRQVHTPNGRIDLLCIDREGLIVVVELKKGRTSREVVAQALDYASWAKDLNADDVEAIAKDCGKIGNDGSLQDAFDEKFEVDRGDRVDLCEGHRSIVVAEDIDDSTERIVRYLSELRVPINIARMHVFKDSTGQEMLAQVFLVEPEVARDRTRSSSNRPSAIAYRRFWTEFLPALRAAYKDAYKDWTNPRKPSSEQWMGFASGSGWGNYHAAFCRAADGRYRLRAEVYIDTNDKETTKEVFDKLYAQKQQLEQSVGEALEWDRLDRKRASRISLYFDGDMRITQEDRWPAAIEWLVSAMGKMRATFGPATQGL